MEAAVTGDVVNDQILSGIGALFSGLIQMIEPTFPVVGLITLIVLVVKFVFGRRRPR